MAAVSAEPRIAPSPARLRRAWRAGLRPRPRWLLLAAIAWLASAAIGGMTALGIARGVGPIDLSVAPDLEGAMQPLVLGAVLIAGGVLAVLLVVRATTQGLGGVALEPASDLPREPARLPGGAALGLALLALAVTLVSVRGVIAGAARAVAASEAGLRALWHETAAHGLATLGGILALVGALEWIGLSRAQRRALRLDEAGARAERRREGARR